MKKLLLGMLVSATWILAAQNAENLVRNPDFQPPLWKEWHCNAPKNFLAEKDGERNVIVIKGNTPAKGFQRIIQTYRQLKGADLAGREITLSFDAKAEKLSGNVSFAIREIDAAGKSLRYQTVKLTKYDQHDWKNYTKTFKLSPKTDAIALHITADYLDGEDSFRFANLKLTMQPAGK